MNYGDKMKKIEFIKNKIKIFINRATMFQEFYQDYKNYKKWNYNNPVVKTRAAQESKMLRQAHMIEKGMSLSAPRKGFGQQKIQELFEMMDQYLKMGYPSDGMPFQDAIIVLNAYVDMQKKLGYENIDMIEKLKSYDKYRIDGLEAGIKHDTRENLLRHANKPFPEFFYSRHSMRQFDSKAISIEDIKKAIKIAQKAPTACNRQASKVYLYTDKATNGALGELIAGNTGFQQEVQNYLVVTADVSAFYDTFERNQVYVEAGLFSMALVEALHYYGIGSCILQNGEYYKKNRKFKDICKNIPENERIVLFIAVGYYKDEFSYALSLRKNVEDVFVVK